MSLCPLCTMRSWSGYTSKLGCAAAWKEVYNNTERCTEEQGASEVGAYICIHVARALLFPCQPSAVSLWYYLMAVLRRSSPLETDRRRAAQRCVSLVTACTQGRRLDLFITFIYIQLTFENTCLKKTQTLKLLHPVKLSCVCI